MRGPLVSDLMTRPVVTAAPGTSFEELVSLLAEHGIAAVPVIDEHRRPIGVVGETDLLARHGRAVHRPEPARHPARLPAAGRGDQGDRGARRAAAVDLGGPSATVQVDDGVVTLSGVIDRRSEVERAEWLTGSIPGVVAVRNRLKYAQDDGAAAESR